MDKTYDTAHLSALRSLFKQHIDAFVAENSSLRLNQKHLVGAAMWAWMVDSHLVSPELQRVGEEVHHGRKTGADGHPLWRIAYRGEVRRDERLDALFDGRRVGPTPAYARLVEEGFVPREPGELIKPREQVSPRWVEPRSPVPPFRAPAPTPTAPLPQRYQALEECVLAPSGTQWLYVYTTTRELKLFTDQLIPRPNLKVGSTTNHYSSRIAAQAGSTAANSSLVCLYAYRVEDARQLERSVHSSLKNMERHIKDAPGIEWFDATPEETHTLIQELYQAAG